MSNGQRAESKNSQDIRSRNFQRTAKAAGQVFQVILASNGSDRPDLPPSHAVDSHVYPAYPPVYEVTQSIFDDSSYNTSGTSLYTATLRSDKTYDIRLNGVGSVINLVALLARRNSHTVAIATYPFEIYSKFRLEKQVRGTLTHHTYSPANFNANTGATYTLPTPDSVIEKVFGVRMECIPATPSNSIDPAPGTDKLCVFWFGLTPATLPSWPQSLVSVLV